MRILIVCAYLCSASGLLLWCLLATDVMGSVGSLDDEVLFFILLAPPPILQWLYVRRMSGFIHLKHYKPTNALDDMSLNEMDGDVQVVTTGAGWKAVNTINSLILMLCFIGLTFSLPYLLPGIFSDDYETAVDFAKPVMLALYFFAVPTVIFNLRTFNLQRIRQVS